MGYVRVIELMTAYFKWELAVPDERFLPPFWQQQRAGDNLASVHWLYNRKGEAFLLELGEKIHRNMARWDETVASWHNVNIAECFRAPGTYHRRPAAGTQAGSAPDRAACGGKWQGSVPISAGTDPLAVLVDDGRCDLPPTCRGC